MIRLAIVIACCCSTWTPVRAQDLAACWPPWIGAFQASINALRRCVEASSVTRCQFPPSGIWRRQPSCSTLVDVLRAHAGTGHSGFSPDPPGCQAILQGIADLYASRLRAEATEDLGCICNSLSRVAPQALQPNERFFILRHCGPQPGCPRFGTQGPLGATPQPPQGIPPRDQLAMILDAARLSSDVYQDAGSDVPRAGGGSFRRIHQEQGRFSGFFAATYYDPVSGDAFIAYRGTQQIRDWVTGNTFVGGGYIGFEPIGVQQAQAIDYANRQIRMLQQMGTRSVMITGHSLGGQLADIAHSRTDDPAIRPAITFNQAPSFAPLSADRSILRISNAADILGVLRRYDRSQTRGSRYEFDVDLIPTSPPSSWGAAVGDTQDAVDAHGMGRLLRYLEQEVARLAEGCAGQPDPTLRRPTAR